MTMGALKRFYEDVACAGMCAIEQETWNYLDDIECARQIDWIGYTEFDYQGRDGDWHSQDCITMESARRLVAEGLANAEIAFFVECFGDYVPDRTIPCGSCGGKHRAGDLTLMRHGERFCEECA